MPLKVECEHCHHEFKAPDKYAGRTAKCPDCSEPLQLPGTLRPQPPGTPRPKKAAEEEPSKDSVVVATPVEERVGIPAVLEIQRNGPMELMSKIQTGLLGLVVEIQTGLLGLIVVLLAVIAFSGPGETAYIYTVREYPHYAAAQVGMSKGSRNVRDEVISVSINNGVFWVTSKSPYDYDKDKYVN